MALLSAEDVLNKAFSKTKYREGFDQDEVDDFLDEVAHTIQSLTAERDDLAQRLAQAQAGQPTTPAAPAEPAAAEAPSTEGGLLAAATDPTPPSATGMLAMAQKLHDEYVHAGEEERDRILDEAKTKAESIVEQAETDAKDRMDSLATERSELERKIDDLRRFERDYRGRLKSYLENLLGDLDHGAKSDSSSLGVSEGFGAPTGGPSASSAVLAGAPSGVSSEDAGEADEDSDAPQAPQSPWAQVRPQDAGDSVDDAAGDEPAESAAPWGASSYSSQSDVASQFGADSVQDDQQR